MPLLQAGRNRRPKDWTMLSLREWSRRCTLSGRLLINHAGRMATTGTCSRSSLSTTPCIPRTIPPRRQLNPHAIRRRLGMRPSAAFPRDRHVDCFGRIRGRFQVAGCTQEHGRTHTLPGRLRRLSTMCLARQGLQIICRRPRRRGTDSPARNCGKG